MQLEKLKKSKAIKNIVHYTTTPEANCYYVESNDPETNDVTVLENLKTWVCKWLSKNGRSDDFTSLFFI